MVLCRSESENQNSLPSSHTHRHAALKCQQHYRQSHCISHKLFPQFSLIIRNIEKCFKQHPYVLTRFALCLALLLLRQAAVQLSLSTIEYQISSTSVQLFRRLNIRMDRRELPIMRTCHAFTS